MSIVQGELMRTHILFIMLEHGLKLFLGIRNVLSFKHNYGQITL